MTLQRLRIWLSALAALLIAFGVVVVAIQLRSDVSASSDVANATRSVIPIWLAITGAVATAVFAARSTQKEQFQTAKDGLRCDIDEAMREARHAITVLDPDHGAAAAAATSGTAAPDVRLGKIALVSKVRYRDLMELGVPKPYTDAAAQFWVSLQAFTYGTWAIPPAQTEMDDALDRLSIERFEADWRARGFDAARRELLLARLIDASNALATVLIDMRCP